MDRQSTLRYIRAACHLYGVVSFKEMSRLLEYYTTQKYKSNQLVQILEKNGHVLKDIRYNKELVYSDIYFENDQDASSFHQTYGAYKKYVPWQEVFLRYASEQYYEQDPAIQKLTAFLEKQMASHEMAKYMSGQLVDNIVFSLQAEIPVEEILDELLAGFEDEHFLFYLPDFGQKAAYQLEKMLNEVKLNLRRISLRGFTEKERMTS